MDIHFLTEFGSNYQMHFLALDEMDTLLGFIDANIYEFRISISSIYVFEEYRGNGIADVMLDEFLMTLSENNLFMDVSFTYVLDDEIKELDKFINRRPDFSVYSDSYEFVVSSDVWNNCKMSERLRAYRKKAEDIKKLTGRQKNSVVKGFMNYAIDITDYGKTIDQIYNPELSFTVLDKEELKAGLLSTISEKADGPKTIEIKALMCEPGSEMHLMTVLAAFFTKAIDKYKEYEIRFVTISESAENLVNKLFEGKVQRKAIKTAVWDM